MPAWHGRSIGKAVLATSLAILPILSPFPQVSSADTSVNSIKTYGLKDGRLLKCRQKSNCISTSAINSVEKYSPPWEFSQSPQKEYDDLVEAVKSTSYLDLVEQDRDLLYLRAEAKSAFPPTGIDDVEFLINPKDKLITYRSNSRTVVSTGSDIVGDAGSNRNRLLSLQKKLGVKQMGQDDEVDKFMKMNDKMNFIEKLRMASQPSEINFLDNSVPESPTSDASGST
eukprot:gene38146-46352_t